MHTGIRCAVAGCPNPVIGLSPFLFFYAEWRAEKNKQALVNGERLVPQEWQALKGGDGVRLSLQRVRPIFRQK
jgi:hypothetical protein